MAGYKGSLGSRNPLTCSHFLSMISVIAALFAVFSRIPHQSADGTVRLVKSCEAFWRSVQSY